MRTFAWIISLAGFALFFCACSSPTLTVTVVNKTATTVDSFMLFDDEGPKEMTGLEPNEPQTVVILVPSVTGLLIESAGQKKVIDIQFHMEPDKILELRIEEGNVVHWTYTIDDIFSAPVTKTGVARDIKG